MWENRIVIVRLFLFLLCCPSHLTKLSKTSLLSYTADVKQNCLSSQTSFRGCLRKLTLTKGPQVQSYDFSRAFDLQGVFPHSCPGTEPWTSEKLLNWESLLIFSRELFLFIKISSIQISFPTQVKCLHREILCYVELKLHVQQIPLLNSLKCPLNSLAPFSKFFYQSL